MVANLLEEELQPLIIQHLDYQAWEIDDKFIQKSPGI